MIELAKNHGDDIIQISPDVLTVFRCLIGFMGSRTKERWTKKHAKARPALEEQSGTEFQKNAELKGFAEMV